MPQVSGKAPGALRVEPQFALAGQLRRTLREQQAGQRQRVAAPRELRVEPSLPGGAVDQGQRGLLCRGVATHEDAAGQPGRSQGGMQRGRIELRQLEIGVARRPGRITGPDQVDAAARRPAIRYGEESVFCSTAL